MMDDDSVHCWGHYTTPTEGVAGRPEFTYTPCPLKAACLRHLASASVGCYLTWIVPPVPQPGTCCQYFIPRPEVDDGSE